MSKKLRTIKASLLIALLGTLLSCQHTPDNYFKTQDQLSVEFVYETVQLPDGTTKEFISIEKSICRSRDYEVSAEFIGSRGIVRHKPSIKDCQLMIGYGPQENRRWVSFMKWIQLQINQEGFVDGDETK